MAHTVYRLCWLFAAEIVRLLLEKGADVHCVTNTLDTPLHGSVAGNQPLITDMLIKAGHSFTMLLSSYYIALLRGPR